MYAVIFTAEIENIDECYFETAERMRELAINEYGCTDFSSVSDENKEISISYWKSEDQIIAWKQDKEHQKAQKLGKD